MRVLITAILALAILGSCNRLRYSPAEREAVDFLLSSLEEPDGFKVKNVSSAEMSDRQATSLDTTYYFQGTKVQAADSHETPHPAELEYDSMSIRKSWFEGVHYTSVGIHYQTKDAVGEEHQHFQNVIVCECGNKGSLLDFMRHRNTEHRKDSIWGVKVDK